MERRRDPWAVWRTVEPDVEAPPRGAAVRRRRATRHLREEVPDVPLRRWWQV